MICLALFFPASASGNDSLQQDFQMLEKKNDGVGVHFKFPGWNCIRGGVGRFFSALRQSLSEMRLLPAV